MGKLVWPQLDLKFNSFINMIGEQGHNLPIDLVNEFGNRIYCQFLSACHGNLTSKNIERRTRCVGILVEFVDMLQAELARDNHVGRTPKQSEAWKVDLHDCTQLLLEENALF